MPNYRFSPPKIEATKSAVDETWKFRLPEISILWRRRTEMSSVLAEWGWGPKARAGLMDDAVDAAKAAASTSSIPPTTSTESD